MWKRHAGFDVVCWEGNATGVNSPPSLQVPHSLSKTPEMVWVKNRDGATSQDEWFCYHKGLNSGNNPQEYYLKLNSSAAQDQYTLIWNNTAPSASHFTVGSFPGINDDGENFIAMLFASVDGISKVGSYTGTE